MGDRLFSFLLLGGAVFVGLLAQVLIKARLQVHGIMPFQAGPFLRYVFELVKDGLVWLALLMLVFSAVSWYGAVSRVPLSYAYPIAALSYPMLLIVAFFFLGEKITVIKVVANLLILTGVLLMGLNQTS